MSQEITLLAQLCLHYFLYNVLQESFLYNYVCTNTITNYLFFAQLCLHKYYYINNVLQECHKKINFLHKYFFIYRVFFLLVSKS